MKVLLSASFRSKIYRPPYVIGTVSDFVTTLNLFSIPHFSYSVHYFLSIHSLNGAQIFFLKKKKSIAPRKSPHKRQQMNSKTEIKGNIVGKYCLLSIFFFFRFSPRQKQKHTTTTATAAVLVYN